MDLNKDGSISKMEFRVTMRALGLVGGGDKAKGSSAEAKARSVKDADALLYLPRGSNRGLAIPLLALTGPPPEPLRG